MVPGDGTICLTVLLSNLPQAGSSRESSSHIGALYTMVFLAFSDDRFFRGKQYILRGLCLLICSTDAVSYNGEGVEILIEHNVKIHVKKPQTNHGSSVERA